MATASKLSKLYKYHYVYKITNLFPTTNERFYVGAHSCDCPPEKDNYWGSSEFLNEAIDSQGMLDFAKEILSVWKTREEANAEEERIHWELDVRNHSEYYNRRNAAKNFHNGGWSDETRERVSQWNKERCAQPEVKKHKSETTTALWKNEEYRKKVISKQKERYEDPDYSEKMSKMLTDRNKDPEFIKKVSKGVKKSWACPKAKAERSAINKKAANTPEEKKRRSETMKRIWAERKAKKKGTISGSPSSSIC